ncbi:hypothetical protein ACIBG6_33150 [Streptomyces sp. NPDC050842]|uniref:hypothetical protein n=1 Tax=Streptomyces sp. NPDC050842 TaxID=3365636 RepID=UPI0037B8C353
MTAEHPRPTSRITDALLPTPPAPPAPAPPPERSTPRPPEAPAPLAPPTARPASEHPKTPANPPRSAAPEPPVRSTPRTAPASAPLAPATVRPASERPTEAGNPPSPARSTPRTAPASAPLAPPAVQGGAERATAAPVIPPPLPPVAPPHPASAAPEPPAATGTPVPAYPPAPPHPAPAAALKAPAPAGPQPTAPQHPAAPKAPTATGTPAAPPQRLAAPEAPRSGTADGALRQPRPAGPPMSSAPARPESPPAAARPVAPPAVPASGPSARTTVPHAAPDTSEARRGAASPRPSAGSAPLTSRQAPAPARAWASSDGAGGLPEVETTTRLRPIRDTPRTAHATRPAPAPVTAYGYGLAGALPPEAPAETTTRLRPVRERRTGRVLAVTACVVLGVGLIGGALAGIWLASADPAHPAEPAGYTEAKDLWHNAPVDTLFPRTLAGPGAGPGAAARTWTRIVVAPDTPCSPAVLAKGLLATLTPLGCERVLRATYTDATASSVITVGLVFTRAEADAQRTLGQGGLTARLGADVPPALSGPSTVAARFGARQRASWWLSAPADLPVVVTAVSGFADGRAVDRPQPADQAMARGRTDATAQSGLGHEAKGITARFEALLRKAVAATAKEKETAR